MSADQTIPQIHPLAEQQETAFFAGVLRQRNLLLASENVALKQRIANFEETEKTLQAQIEHLQEQLAEAAEVHHGNPT
ncbi:hypothetical protein [Pseudochrobactrum asaccharolyticum]|uniref:Uncharacterized protein n=1 Tax=Pseudochrobactrum asaccharolyticum TaxID=354351 RepID=A0A366DGW2_9HYPH|nr:hypothetical protein [Pseudochrobactrum asaccharolyticum]RBO89317.1 hypothetical protein DFR47_11645 [Pseudochrobactrum asaccharolyticum]